MLEAHLLQDATAFGASDLDGDAVDTQNFTAMLVWFTPTGSYDGTATFQISPDDGVTWFVIDGRLISEIETPINAINTPAANALYTVVVPTNCLFRVQMSGGTQGALTVRAALTH